MDNCQCSLPLEEESEDLASQVLPPRLLVVHDAPGGGQHHVSELSGGKQIVGPLLNVVDGNIKPEMKDLKIFVK